MKVKEIFIPIYLIILMIFHYNFSSSRIGQNVVKCILPYFLSIAFAKK